MRWLAEGCQPLQQAMERSDCGLPPLELQLTDGRSWSNLIVSDQPAIPQRTESRASRIPPQQPMHVPKRQL